MGNDNIFHFLSEVAPGSLHFGEARMALLDIASGFWSIRRQMEALIGSRMTNSVLQQAGANGGASFAFSFGAVEDASQQGQLFKNCVQAYQTAGFGQFEIMEIQWPIGRVTIRAREAFEAWMNRHHKVQSEGPACAYTAGVLVGFVNVISNRQDVVCIERHCQAVGDEACEFELLPVAEAGDQSVVAFTPDPTLGRQLNLLEMLFERMPMGLAVIDRDYKLVRTNPTWAAFIDQYTPSKAHQVVPGARIFDLEPGTEDVLVPLFERVFEGETVRQDAVRIESGGVASFWDIVLSPLHESDRVVGLLNVSIDATERVLAQQTLEQRVEERTRELSTLLEISQNVSSTLDLDTLLGTVLEQLKPVVDYSGASLMALDAEQLHILAYRGPIEREEIKRLRFHLDPSTANFKVIHSGKPLIIPDVYADTAAARSFRRTAGKDLQSVFGYIRCWMGIPLTIKGRVIGMLSLDYDQPAHYTSTSAALALAFANQAAVAIENARLFQEIKRRREVAESLRDIIGMINSRIPLDAFLERAVKLAAQRIGAAACVLHQFDLTNRTISQVACYGMEDVFPKRRVRSFDALKPSGGEGYLQATLQRQPTYTNYLPLPERVDEIKRDPTIPDHIKAERVALRERFAGSFSVPLFIQDKVYGGMVFYYGESQDFSDEQIQIGLTFAEQVAIALENARLFQDAEQRRRVAESLTEILAVLNSDRTSQEIFDFLTKRSCELLFADACLLYRVDNGVVAQESGYNLPTALASLKSGELYPGKNNRDLSNFQPVAVNDVASYLRTILENSNLQDFQHAWYEGVLANFNAYLGIPVVVSGQLFGGLVFYYKNSRSFTSEDIQLAETLGGHSALAIENAMLRAQATEIAKLSERNRLARDLHDAVSQTLFSASLIADVLPKLWERNPEAGKQKLDELRLLTRGALSEMRTLLLELRPASLVDMDLGDLLRHLTNAFTGRTRVSAELSVDGQVDQTPVVKEVFYRVAQEALNNISKHAGASQVSVHLQRDDEQIRLQIRDDGCGFDPQSISPESLGLGIMRERVETIGAQLEIHSEFGVGTRIELTWKDVQE